MAVMFNLIPSLTNFLIKFFVVFPLVYVIGILTKILLFNLLIIFACLKHESSSSAITSIDNGLSFVSFIISFVNSR